MLLSKNMLLGKTLTTSYYNKKTKKELTTTKN